MPLLTLTRFHMWVPFLLPAHPCVRVLGGLAQALLNHQLPAGAVACSSICLCFPCSAAPSLVTGGPRVLEGIVEAVVDHDPLAGVMDGWCCSPPLSRLGLGTPRLQVYGCIVSLKAD